MSTKIKQCTQCSKSFNIDVQDLAFYERIDVPEPTLCPDCRQQRRLSWRNLTRLYQRNCDATQLPIISVYSQDKPFTVYSQEYWWSDKWSPFDYGQPYDANRPFFEQFAELQHRVPRLALYNISSENCNYTHHSGYNTNCYMCFNVGTSENCFYCTNFVLDSRDSLDLMQVNDAELSYESVTSKTIYNSSYIVHSTNIKNSQFLYDCTNCSDCYMSYNLRNKQYCINNIQYTKEDYQKKLLEIQSRTYEDFQRARESFVELIESKAKHRFARIQNSEDSTGDDIRNCRNVKNSYSVFNAENCRFVYDCGDIKDCYDVVEPWKGELQYECHGANESTNVIGCSVVLGLTDSAYSEYSFNSSNIFGCISVRQAKYCILNVQYSKDEYRKLVGQIKHNMKRDGEWGNFFPMSLSPFAYNETVAQEYYPLSRQDVLRNDTKRDLTWKDIEQPAAANEHACLDCGRAVQVVAQEQVLYDQLELPVPQRCFYCRHTQRFDFRASRALWTRQCMCTQPDHTHKTMQCPVEFETTYAPDRKEIVYCESCYNKEIY